MFRILVAASFLFGYSANAQNKISSDDLRILRDRMTGIFDSQEQAGTDPAYANITLHGREIDIKGKKSGYLIYIEQETASGEGSVYQQRVYHIYKDQDRIAAKAYELNDPSRFVGGWADPSVFKKLKMDSLQDRQGCAIYLTKDDQGNYSGSTSREECTATQNNSIYASSDLYVGPNMMIIWDRGWDASGRQVWGPEKGGYRFRKFTLNR